MPQGLLAALGLKPRPQAPSAGSASDGADQPPPQASQAPGDAGEPGSADAREIEQARKRVLAFSKPVDEQLARAEKAIQAIVVESLRKTLSAELDALRQRRLGLDKMPPVEGAAEVRLLDSKSHELALRAESLGKSSADAANYLRDRGDQPFADLKTLFEAQPADVKSVYQARFDQIKTWLAACRSELDAGRIDGLIDKIGRVYIQCQDLRRAIEQYAALKPKYDELRKKTQAMLKRMEGSPLLDADGQKAVAELKTAVSAADALGPVRGYAAAIRALEDVVAQAVQARDRNENYRNYSAERDKVAQGVEAVRRHPQAAQLQAEIADLDAQLSAANVLASRSDGGALKALTALKPIAADALAAKNLGDKLAAAAKSLPKLKDKLKAGGLPDAKLEAVSRMAMKAMVEESCSEDEAVAMARDASGYADEGMNEADAVMSSRVKRSLQQQGLEAEHARSIGRNVRAGGSGNADDAKALAASMKGMSKKAIDTLNDAGIHAACCRGAITDAVPELAGVKPRGWPETASWDEVPGVYDPSTKTLTVGTIEEGGKRVVPEKDKGDNPHGAHDLVGHEAGHALDDTPPKPKRTHADFLKARDADKASGKLKGSRDGGNDDYFLTVNEGGANDKGATSETFAESYAMHTKGGGRWPELGKFWAANPWGL